MFPLNDYNEVQHDIIVMNAMHLRKWHDMEVESSLKTFENTPINDSPLQTSKTPSQIPLTISFKSSKASTKKIPTITAIRKGILVKASSQSSQPSQPSQPSVQLTGFRLKNM